MIPKPENPISMQNRRKFLKNSVLTAMGAGLASRTASGSNPAFKSQQNNFVYRVLGKTGIRIPIISMGTGNTNNPNLVSQALDSGIRLLATSEAYSDGNNEKMIGEVVKGRPRDSFMVMTSSIDINEVDLEAGIFKPDVDPNNMLKRVDGCLSRLQLDYLDIFILGFAARRESVFFEPFLEAMETIKKQGKAKYIGIATHMFEHEAIRAAADTGIYDLAMTSYNFRMTNLNEVNEAIQYAAEKNMGIIAMKTMAGAYWDNERTKPINGTAALKWVLQNENIHTTVPDCSTYDQLVQDIAIMGNLELTDEERLDLEPPAGDLSYGLFCQQCGGCIPQCPKNVSIPTIMRSYMYAYGYRNLAHAKRTLHASQLDPRLCRDCDECKVICQMGFDVKTKILDIARLQDVPDDFIHLA